MTWFLDLVRWVCENLAESLVSFPFPLLRFCSLIIGLSSSGMLLVGLDFLGLVGFCCFVCHLIE